MIVKKRSFVLLQCIYDDWNFVQSFTQIHVRSGSKLDEKYKHPWELVVAWINYQCRVSNLLTDAIQYFQIKFNISSSFSLSLYLSPLLISVSLWFSNFVSVLNVQCQILLSAILVFRVSKTISDVNSLVDASISGEEQKL